MPSVSVERVIAFSLAVLPVIILMVYFTRANKAKKPQVASVVKVFVFGCLSTLPVILIEWFMGLFELLIYFKNGYIYANLFRAYAIAGGVEELSKFFVVLFVVYESRKEFNTRMDGIVYAAAASLGFALVENVLYVNAGGIQTAILRGVVAVPSHALDGALMGYFVALARFDRKREYFYFIAGILLAIFFHGTYDFILFQFGDDPYYWYLAYLIFPWVALSLVIVQSFMKNLREEDVHAARVRKEIAAARSAAAHLK